MDINGVVVSLGREGKVSKAGKPFTVHSITLDSGQTLEVGFKQTYVVGQRVVGQAEMKYGKLALVSGGGGTAGGTSSGGAAPSSSPPAFPVSYTAKDMSICRQSALKAAVDVCNAVLPSDNMELDDYVEKVIEVAYKFTDFSTGQREVKMVEKDVGK